jgi:murein DD-endopeptidase MepM/ murein hydrolase activator NlpD
VNQGDLAEFFFDLKDETNPDGALGEMLYTALNAGGELHKFWRFRTPDGVVDYYDESGNNSKKFLMRRPVRGDTVHFTSGFGIRFHPVLRYSRPHNGIDWAGPVGVPIVAAGNGVISFIGRRGEFGNHVEIRHANGYETTYSHMVRFETGMAENVKVRQGQVIGYVGATGLVSGPHLHFEVKLNAHYVDPLTIEVPNERKLTGRQLADFQKERARIDDLMRRAPVMSETR